MARRELQTVVEYVLSNRVKRGSNQHYYCHSICLFYCLLLFCMLTIFSCMLMCVVTLWSSFDYKADFDRVVRVSNNIGISPSKKLR